MSIAGSINGYTVSSDKGDWLYFPSAGGASWGGITGTLSDQTDLQTALDLKLTKNIAISGSTKTKITYDANGLVTAGAGATTADIPDSTNKRYVTDANLTTLGLTSGTNTGDQDLSGLVPTSRTVNGHALSGNVTVTATDLGLVIGTNTEAWSVNLDSWSALATSAKVDANGAITGATKTKVTYDTKGLVTSGSDATTADISDSTNKRYVTDAELTVISNTSGTNTGDQTLVGLGGVPTTRTITINGSAQDLSSNRTWTVTASPDVLLSLSSDSSIADGYGRIYPHVFTIGSGVKFTIGSGSILQIT